MSRQYIRQDRKYLSLKGKSWWLIMTISQMHVFIYYSEYTLCCL